MHQNLMNVNKVIMYIAMLSISIYVDNKLLQFHILEELNTEAQKP